MRVRPDFSLYLVAELGGSAAHTRTFVDAVLCSIDGGVTTVELCLEGASLAHRAEAIEIAGALSATLPSHVTFVLGTSLDTYLAVARAGCRVDGMRLLEGSTSLSLVRGMLGPSGLLGLRITSDATVVTPAIAGVDFVTLPPPIRWLHALSSAGDVLNVLAQAEVPVVLEDTAEGREPLRQSGVNVRGVTVGSDVLRASNPRLAAALRRQEDFEAPSEPMAPSPRTETADGAHQLNAL